MHHNTQYPTFEYLDTYVSFAVLCSVVLYCKPVLPVCPLSLKILVAPIIGQMFQPFFCFCFDTLYLCYISNDNLFYWMKSVPFNFLPSHYSVTLI
jgi:hypothetical protein